MARYLSRETLPYGKWNGIPIYLTTLLTVAFVIGLFVSAILKSAGSPLLTSLVFNLPNDSWSGWFSSLSYIFVGLPDFFTPLGIICFYFWSVGIESHLGRGPLVRLWAILTFLPVAIAAVLWFGFGTGSLLFGNFLFTSGLLVAFATLYPNSECWGWIPFKWLAFACIVCGSLMLISDRNWIKLSELWLVCFAAFFYMRHAVEQDYDDYVPLAVRIRTWLRKKPKLRVVPRPALAPRKKIVDDFDDEPDSDVDALLDKIAKTGLASLSREERAKLEKAREALLKKEQR